MQVILAALVVLLAAGAANFIIDPMGVFFAARLPGVNTYKPEILNYWRTALPLRAHLVRPQTAVLGSSRVLYGIDTGDAQLLGPDAFNLGLPAATLCDIEDAYEIALAGGRLQRIVIGLDFFAANARRIGPDCGVGELRHQPRLALAKTLFSSGTLNAAQKTVTKQRRVDASIWQPSASGTAWLPPGHIARRGGAHKMFLEVEDIYARDYFLLAPACDFRFGSPADPEAALGHLRRVLASAHAHGVAVRLFFSPEHARLLGLIEATGLMGRYVEWMGAVARINAEEARKAGKAVPALTAHFAADAINEPLPPREDMGFAMRWFLDSSHYTPALGRRVLEEPAAIAQAQRDAAVIRERIAAYFMAHPAERAEIDAAAARARERCAGR
ncbi:MAG: hypothetical protein JNM79_21925 [Burkholderiales bacterium]|nr:hypothetical protein [Burkholderiales bacterium]